MGRSIFFLSTSKNKGSDELRRIRHALSNKENCDLSDMCIEPRRKGANEKKGIKEQVISRAQGKDTVICDDFSLSGKNADFSAIPERICLLSPGEYWARELDDAMKTGKNLKKMFDAYNKIICTFPLFERYLSDLTGISDDERIVRCLPSGIDNASRDEAVNQVRMENKIPGDANICYVSLGDQDEIPDEGKIVNEILTLMKLIQGQTSGKIVYIFRSSRLSELIMRECSNDFDVRVEYPGTDTMHLSYASCALITDDLYLIHLFKIGNKRVELIEGTESGKAAKEVLSKAHELQMDERWSYDSNKYNSAEKEIVDILDIR
ncbi:hypothetical protein [Butyrivibrio sp. MB2005]|uniref:hypothetical protein n=1 Tax=Butyrivibrio sp. MB2005 TaxID=1280678 RepID=UPI0004090CFD|nr:hypothetical protein [Butyrivibrio sp. MB2005]